LPSGHVAIPFAPCKLFFMKTNPVDMFPHIKKQLAKGRISEQAALVKARAMAAYGLASTTTNFVDPVSRAYRAKLLKFAADAKIQGEEMEVAIERYKKERAFKGIGISTAPQDDFLKLAGLEWEDFDLAWEDHMDAYGECVGDPYPGGLSETLTAIDTSELFVTTLASPLLSWLERITYH